MATGELRLAMDPDAIDIELRTVDREIIEMLEDGRCTRRHLADTLGYTGEYVYQRVTRLMEHGIVEKIHDGFYELAADGGVEAAERDADAPDVASVAEDDASGDVALGDDLPEHVDCDDARDAVRAALDALNGGASKAEIVRAVMPSHPLGYDVDAALAKVDAEGERYRGAWWRRVIKPGLEANGCEFQSGRGWTR